MDGPELNKMGSKREDVDLELMLKDPDAAREWIDDFRKNHPELQEFVFVDEERSIDLNKMTDDDAVEAAWRLVEDFEIRRAVYDASIAEGLNQIH